LNEFIEREMTACTDIKKPTAYFLLDKMAQQGWITMRETREGNRPPRRVYRLTARGEAEYQKLLRENLGSFIAAKFPGDVGLAYADDLDPQEVLTLLAERRSALAAQLEAARQVPPHAGSLQLLVDHQVAHLEAELAWLDQIIAKFKKKAKQG
jgi:DNA-binding PadR family transcriptional regulator